MAWEVAQTKFYDDETEARLKQAFAEALLRNPNNPYEAARFIEPTQSEGRAHWIVNNWLHDPQVIQIMGERVSDLGARASIPTKEELALTVYREAQDVKDKSTKLAYYRAVADIMGYVQKGGVNINNNNGNVFNGPKVQIVPVFNTDADFEGYAKRVDARLEAM